MQQLKMFNSVASEGMDRPVLPESLLIARYSDKQDAKDHWRTVNIASSMHKQRLETMVAARLLVSAPVPSAGRGRILACQ